MDHIYTAKDKINNFFLKKIHQYFQLTLAKANNILTFADVLG